ncbi:MAG: TIGR04282 family arsenosugar biosynthesis glycosyltransferase [Rhodothermia bacterium]
MQSFKQRRALIVFGKNPVAGHVKTRLARSIGDVPAATLYRAFLLDSLEAFSALDADLRLYLAPSDAAIDPHVDAAFPDFLIQSGDGLGERMSNAFKETFETGYSNVGIVGSDHPSIPVNILRRGLARVRNGNVVLGPSDDGGYCFLALDRHRPQLFSGIQYGRPDVLDATMHKARMFHVEATLLDSWYDVDAIEDLRRLTADLKTDPDICPRTRRTMKRLGIF